MANILKGISIIDRVSPKVKNKGVSKSKGNISKNVGQIKKYQDEREDIIEENLKRAKEGEKSIYGTVEETQKELEKLRGKNLGCWCKPEGCHGDIILSFLEN